MQIAGGVREGRELKAVIPGGSSVPVVPAAAILDATMDYNGLKKIGTSLGTGAVIVMDETTCMVSALRRISRFYYAESCGQCTPCREGTGWLYRMLNRILEARDAGDLKMLLDVANHIEGHTICALGDAAAWPVQSFLRHFMPEFEYMIEHGGRSIIESRAEAADERKTLRLRSMGRAGSAARRDVIAVMIGPGLSPALLLPRELSSPPTAACARGVRTRPAAAPARHR